MSRPLSTMSNDPVLDPDALAALQAVSPDDGGQFFNELIDIFLTDTPARLGEITVGLQKQDAPGVMRAAHSIKGSAGNFGAGSLAKIAYEIEHAARDSKLAEVPALVPTIEAEFARVQAALLALRGK